MDLIAFAVWRFLVALAGGLVGLVLGNIRLPAAVLLGSSPGAAAGANIGIGAVAAVAIAVGERDRCGLGAFRRLTPRAGVACRR